MCTHFVAVSVCVFLHACLPVWSGSLGVFCSCVCAVSGQFVRAWKVVCDRTFRSYVSSCIACIFLDSRLTVIFLIQVALKDLILADYGKKNK